MAVSIDVLAAHARAIAAAFRVPMIEDPACTFFTAQAQHLYKQEKLLEERVIVPPITTEEAFAAAMHELGHCLAATGSLRRTEAQQGNHLAKMEEERAAWEWARHYSKPYWTDKMEALALFAYETHRQSILLKQRQEAMRKFGAVRRKPGQSVADFIKGIK